MQIKLLKILAKLGAGEKNASDNMAAVIGATLKKAAAGGHTIGNAIVFEAVRTITGRLAKHACCTNVLECT